MHPTFERMPGRAMLQSPRRSQTAIRPRLRSPARNPGTSIAGRPSPGGGSGQRAESRVERTSPSRRCASKRLGLPGRVKVAAWASALTAQAIYPARTRATSSASTLVDEGDREVIAGDDGEEHRIQAVDQAA